MKTSTSYHVKSGSPTKGKVVGSLEQRAFWMVLNFWKMFISNKTFDLWFTQNNILDPCIIHLYSFVHVQSFNLYYVELFNCNFIFLQQLVKKALALHDFTNFSLNIVIKATPYAIDHLLAFASYIESWRVICWKITNLGLM